MKRTIDYQITRADEGIRIEQFLRRQGFSGQNLTLIKRMPQNILLNGQFVYMKDNVHAGDHLRVQINEEASSEKIPPVDLPLDIIYEDEDIIVLNKAAGMPIHPSMANYENSLANALAYYYEKQGKPFIFRCTNRLDRDTSGLTIVAKHLVASSILSDAVAKKEVRREYLAICSGIPDPTTGTIDAPLARVDGTILAREVDFSCGDRAITHYKVEKALNRSHTPDPRTYEIHRVSSDRRLSLQSRYALYEAAGTPFLSHVLYSSDHKGTYDLYRSSATGYGGCTYLSLSRQVITLFYLFCATIMTIVG